MMDLVEKLGSLLMTKRMLLVTAESCTGGLLSATVTHKPGASSFLDRGFITYSNESKTEMLGVPATVIEKHGAVSAEVAKAMAQGALHNSRASFAASITGVAGPDGGTVEKPVGLVYFGYMLKNGTPEALREQFTGTRSEIQSQAVQTALKHMIAILERES